MHGALLIVLLSPMVFQESEEAQEYRRQFAQYEEMLEIQDPAERATAFLDFGDQEVDERLLGGVAQSIQAGLEALAGTDALYSLADRWDAQTGELTGAAMALQSAAATGDDENIVKYGEIIYAVNPVVDIAKVLATSYNALGNEEKFDEYAHVAIEAQGLAENFDYAYNMFQRAEGEEAAEWARRLQELPSAPSGVSAAEWRGMQIEFQRTVASWEFESGRFQNAINEYRTLAGMDRGQRAMSNLFMCRSHLEIGGPDQINQAMARCADAAVLNNATYSGPARALVEQIYTTNTGGTLEGFDENVLAPARIRMR